MTQHVIDVNGVPTLFSPVPAHSLEPGDLLCYVIAGGVNAGELTAPVRAIGHLEHGWEVTGRIVRVPVPAVYVGTRYSIPFLLNESVLRAVGARAGRGGAR